MSRILIIEDDDNFQKLLTTHLELEGVDVLTAGNAQEGIKAVRVSRPDLVILDLEVGHIEGYHLFSELKSEEEFRELPVLILLSSAEEEQKIRELSLTGMQYLVKPANLIKMLSAVNRFVQPQGAPGAGDDELTADLELTTVAVAGGGSQGLSLLQFFWGEPRVKLLAFTETSEEDDAFRLAKKFGIHTTTVPTDLLQIPELEMIVALSHGELLRLRRTRQDLEIVGENAAGMLMDLVTEREARVEQARDAAHRLTQRVKELNLVNEVGGLFVGSANLHEVLNRIVMHIARVTTSMLCTIMLVEKGTLRIVAAAGATPFLTQDFVTPLERAIADWVMEHRRPLNVPELRKDPKLGSIDYSIKEDLQSVLAVPLNVREKFFGVLCVYRGEPHEFSKDERNLLSILSQHTSLAIDHGRTVQTLGELHQGFIRTFLEAMDSRDEYSHSHSVFVSRLCRRLCEEMALSEELTTVVEQAALLHDIGKIAIPEAILKKPGKLTEEEKGIVSMHPVTAARILEKMELFKSLVPIILHQGERWDGKGKPRGLRGEEIPVGSRILSVAEAFDALVSKRAYREAYSVEEAIEILLGGSGSLFDPNVLQALLGLLNKEPELRNRWIQEAAVGARN